MRIPASDAAFAPPTPVPPTRDPLTPRLDEMPKSLPADPPHFPQSTSKVIRRMFGIEAYAQREVADVEPPVAAAPPDAERKDVVA